MSDVDEAMANDVPDPRPDTLVEFTRRTVYRDWLGLGKRAPENPRPRFASDDDLWR